MENKPSLYSILPDDQKNLIKNALVNFQGQNVPLKNLIEENEELYNVLTQEQINDLLSGKCIKIGYEIKKRTEIFFPRYFVHRNLDDYESDSDSE
jgi:hypothetical protein